MGSSQTNNQFNSPEALREIPASGAEVVTHQRRLTVEDAVNYLRRMIGPLPENQNKAPSREVQAYKADLSAQYSPVDEAERITHNAANAEAADRSDMLGQARANLYKITNPQAENRIDGPSTIATELAENQQISNFPNIWN